MQNVMIYPVNAMNFKNSDIFSVVKEFAETSNNVQSEEIVVVEEGKSIDDIVSEKAQEKYSIALKDDVNDVVVEDNSSSNAGDNSTSNNKYPNQNSYFAGTVDFTNLNTSKKDTTLNGWSAINASYAKYDDGGEDNITIIATAYTSSAEENGGYAGLNAIGGKLGPGCIAAPKDIPFQTKIRISGLGVFNVEDRGGAIVRVSEDVIRIDVWMNSYKEAMKFGKRVYKGRILN